MNKKAFYEDLNRDIRALLAGETSFLAALGNCSALLFERLEGVNWAGFYLLTEPNTLVLGPFQGKIACVRIPVGKGVCGTAVAEDKVQLVEDVHAFPGHIACDAASNAEIVIPLKVNGTLVGVLDIDSTVYSRFDSEDEAGLVALTDGLCEVLAGSDIVKFIQLTHS
ncbi:MULTISPECIES: GAF domain-containing protein [Enterobacterales]|jgi:GAF domain-containing protein|uniref:GAF domain-containing protein n=1 Tax=Candidatus Pantoea symbiotica TaxID=1884370 RepID=A0A1I3TCB9_9GAMM|nr:MULTISPECIES: GAF domain-containing protein [Enterobacterales]MRS20738.1 GAF domain-containing protein [Enterobacteriaceae bacterium RIT692]MRT23671.1 GAF domain-containing protein [Enterobacteriaceae bacterium RIT697]MRT42508.1 GAF domain-containing protein [Enterobacteriaceae bacterium RIT702]KAJ9432871.1 GAF domain-containing protein [Pantoea sp. YR343]MBB3303754.1 GAF domain-containing protein [Enterobacter sp. Sphag1F]